MASFKYEYLVTIPDVPGTLEKRLKARPTHLANLKPLIVSHTDLEKPTAELLSRTCLLFLSKAVGL